MVKGPTTDRIIIDLGAKRDRVRAREEPDGSLIVDTREAGRRIREILQKRGVVSPAIDEFIDSIEHTPEDLAVDSGLGVAFVKRPIRELEPDLQGELLDDRLVTAMAFGVMATVFGNNILAPFFDPLREWILGKAGPPDYVTVDRWFSGRYVPRHVVLMRAVTPRIELQVQLLGVVYEVAIEGIRYDGPCPAYLEDLVTGNSEFTVYEAKSDSSQIGGRRTEP